MKKLFFFVLIAILLLCVGCGTHTATLHCDGENCQNVVEVTVDEEITLDENWVVFCQDCADNILKD